MTLCCSPPRRRCVYSGRRSRFRLTTIRRRRRPLLESFDGERYFALPLETLPDCGGITGATYLRRWTSERTRSDDWSSWTPAGNSGYSAINLAYLKGAREINLVGFDMDLNTRGKTDLFVSWIPRFRTMLPQLTARGVRVWNHNPNSAIDAFPKVISLSSYLN